MKRLINLAGVYGVLALIGGVFYREFTKFHHFTGKTSLAVVHTHLLTLGVLLLLVLASMAMRADLFKNKHFRVFYKVYNLALPLMVTMLVVRGVAQVLQLQLSRGADMSISGLAGLSHILMAGALGHLFVALRNVARDLSLN